MAAFRGLDKRGVLNCPPLTAELGPDAVLLLPLLTEEPLPEARLPLLAAACRSLGAKWLISLTLVAIS